MALQTMRTAAPRTSGSGAAASRPPNDRRPAVLASLLTVGACLPMITAVVTRAGRTWLPVQDLAVMDLRVRDVWSADVPLVGAYSRYGWNHPGPWMYWGAAPLSALSGRAPWATMIGFALLQAVAVVWLARLCWRRGGLPMVAFGLAVIGVWYHASGSWAIVEPWNPHVVVPFFVVFVFEAWSVATGELRRLPGMAVAATLVIQGHLGYLVLVAAVVVFVVGALVVDVRHDRVRLRDGRRPALIAAGLTALLWLPPLIEEVRRWGDGSLVRTYRFFLRGENPDPTIGLRAGAGLLVGGFRSSVFGDTTDRLTGEAVPVSALWWLVPAVLGSAAIVALWRTRHRGDARLLGISTVLLASGLLALDRLSGPRSPYLFYWRIPVATFFVAACLLAIVRALGLLERPGYRAAGVAALAAVALVPSIALAAQVATLPQPLSPMEDDLAALLAQTSGPTQPTIVRYAGSPLGGLAGGVIDELDRRGAPVRVDPGAGFQWGSGRETPVSAAGEVWYAIEQGQYQSLLTELPGARVVAATTPLSPDEARELQAIDRELAQQLVAAGRPELVRSLDTDLIAFAADGVPGVDHRLLDRAGELAAKVHASGHCRCSIVAFPAGQAPPLTDDVQDPPATWGS